MSRPSRPNEEESGGAPEWMVTFCDCMTLLLTFFVLLLSFATFHKETLPQLGQSFAQALPSMGLSPSERKESALEKMSTDDPGKQTEGSETPTQAKQQTGNYMREKRALDFRNLKVFCAPSETFSTAGDGAFNAGTPNAGRTGPLFGRPVRGARRHQRKRPGRQYGTGTGARRP